MQQLPSTSIPAECLIEKHFEQTLDAARRRCETADRELSLATSEHRAAHENLLRIREAVQIAGSALDYVLGKPRAIAPSGAWRRSHIDCLNDDVLRTIFFWLDHSYDHSNFYCTERLSPAFTVAMVRRQWRTVALATAEIWAKIRITFIDPTPPYFHPAFEQRIFTTIARSRSFGLDFVLSCAPGQKCSIPASSLAVFARALECSRAVHISWYDTILELKSSLLPLLLTDMPRLRRLTMEPHTEENSPLSLEDVPANLNFLTLCPNLRVLELHSFPFQTLDPSTLPNTEVFSMRALVTVPNLELMCRSWPKLRQLTVNGLSGNGSWPADATFPHLDTVTCKVKGRLIISVLPLVCMPRLRTLVLICNRINVISSFRDFISLSPNNLQSLTLTGPFSSLVSDVFTDLHHLTELRLFCISAQGLRTLLTAWNSDTVVGLPAKLTEITCIRCGFGGQVITVLLEYILARIAHATAHPIRRLTIREGGYVSSEHLFPRWMVRYLEQLSVHVAIQVSGAEDLVGFEDR